MAFNTTIGSEQPQSIGTAAATATVFEIHYPAVDVTVSAADIRLAYGIGPLVNVATGDAAPTADYAIMFADTAMTKYNPHRDGALPWRLLIWDTTAAAVVSLQGTIPKGA